MCIVCRTKDAMQAQLDNVEALAISVGELLAVLDRVKGTGFAFGDKESAAIGRAAGLLADDSPATASAPPDGIPQAIWDNMPAELQSQLREAVAMGAKVQLIPIEEALAALDANETKH